MNSKILGVVLFIVAAAIWYVFLRADDRKMLYNAVPDSGLLALETADAKTLFTALGKLPAYKDWLQFDGVQKAQNTYYLLDSMFLQSGKQVKQPLLASLHVTKADEYDVLSLLNAKLLKQPLEQLIDSFSLRGVGIAKRTLKGVSIYELNLPQLRHPFTIAQDGKVVMAALNPMLVDEAVTQSHRIFSGFFNNFYTNSPPEPNNIALHILYKNLPLLDPLFFHAGISNSLFAFLAGSFDSGSYTMQVKPTGVFLNGATHTTPNLLLTNVVEHGASLTPTIGMVLPYNTALLWYNRINDIGSLVKTRNNQWISTGNEWKWAGQEYAMGYTEPPAANLTDVMFVAIACTDSAMALQKLQTYNPNKQKPETYKGYVLHTINGSKLLSALLGEQAAAHFQSGYYTIVQQFVFFATNKEQLQVLIENQLTGQTLQKNSSFTQFMQELNPTSSSFLYVLPNRFDPVIKSIASPAFLSDFIRKNTYYKRFSPITIQFGSQNRKDKIATNISLYYQKNQTKETPDKQEPATLLWSTTLDHAPKGAPQIAVNHYTSEKEIIVTDQNNQLYLINKTGRILWKRALDKPILGKVRQIDFYANQELYYLFNTDTHIYLLDRNGEDVQNFPIKLSATATHGHTLLDPDGNKNYQFFVPCSNKNIYGYYVSGRPVAGWSPRQYLANMAFELRYFTFEKETYLVAANTDGTIYLLATNGSLEKKLVCSSPLIATPQIDLRNGKPHIIATTKNGITHIFDLNGNKTTKQMLHISPTADFFTANINSVAANEEYVFMSNNKVYSFSEKAKLFEFDFSKEDKPTHIFPIKLSRSNAKQIGVFCAATKKAYLLDEKGKNNPHFPMDTNTSFIVADLIDSGADILITGSANKIVAYKLP